MRSYHLAWLSFDSVLCIRKPSLSQLLFSNIGGSHPQKNAFYKFVVGDFNAKIGITEEEEHRIERFGAAFRNENGNCLVGLLSAARPFLWQLHFHEERTPVMDMEVTQRYDSCGDLPHFHQPKVVLTGRLSGTIIQ
ncbi:unnamed protein product [Strongylus vulgaris]|uniref:Endonuclease/exonuclease/phosphatase domain-containing protein n=1 Tax=Strongylus vulgaris TaxID=40348 RepID=A0A3P7JT60_STRVU|nr:unnamed protein product [Strongylus vulgaris]